MPSKKKPTPDQATQIITDLQICQTEVEAAQNARNAAESELSKATETFRLASNRYETAVQTRDAMLIKTVGGN